MLRSLNFSPIEFLKSRARHPGGKRSIVDTMMSLSRWVSEEILWPAKARPQETSPESRDFEIIGVEK